jgi:hypothetical protein
MPTQIQMKLHSSAQQVLPIAVLCAGLQILWYRIPRMEVDWHIELLDRLPEFIVIAIVKVYFLFARRAFSLEVIPGVAV